MSCVQCVICTDLMTEECILSFLECGHVYHQTCLNPWIQTSKTCPECRVTIKSTPRRLYLHFTNQPDLAEMREISRKNGGLEMMITTLQQQNAKKDRVLRLTLTQLNHLVNSNIRFKRAVAELDEKSKSSTEKANQLTQKLKEQTEQRQVLSAIVESMRTQENAMNEKLRQSRVIIDKMMEKIRVLDRSQADRIIENYQLELEKANLITRLDTFRTEFVETNTELHKVKSENENLRNELTVHMVGKREMTELNSMLKEKLEKTEQSLLAMTHENVATTNADHPPSDNDAIDAKRLNLRNDYSSHKLIIKIPSDGLSQPYVKTNQIQETMPKRKIGETIGIADNAKRPKILEPISTEANHVTKIVMTKSSVGWSIVPRSE